MFLSFGNQEQGHLIRHTPRIESVTCKIIIFKQVPRGLPMIRRDSYLNFSLPSSFCLFRFSWLSSSERSAAEVDTVNRSFKTWILVSNLIWGKFHQRICPAIFKVHNNALNEMSEWMKWNQYDLKFLLIWNIFIL